MKTRLLILLQSTLLIISASGCMRPAYEQTTTTLSTQTAPAKKKQCIHWYDGCNSCSQKGRTTTCTERFCKREEYEAFKCYEWE